MGLFVIESTKLQTCKNIRLFSYEIDIKVWPNTQHNNDFIITFNDNLILQAHFMSKYITFMLHKNRPKLKALIETNW